MLFVPLLFHYRSITSHECSITGHLVPSTWYQGYLYSRMLQWALSLSPIGPDPGPCPGTGRGLYKGEVEVSYDDL